MRLKRVLFFSLLFIIFGMVSQESWSVSDFVFSLKGEIKVTRPDEKTLTIKEAKKLSQIQSGSTIEVLSGRFYVVSNRGIINLIVGGSVTTVDDGDSITTSIDVKTKTARFKVHSGAVEIITGNTTSKLKTGSIVQIRLDKRGEVEVKSLKGNIETITIGVKTVIPKGGIAKIKVNPKTRKVIINSEKGVIDVISIDGKIITVAQGWSTTTEALPVGEIQTFIEEAEEEITPIPEEEPAEPELPEASPFRP